MTGKLFKVKALYDFVASHPDDLGFNQNEVLTITNSDYGDGWYYGSNNIGREGMIPSSYVEALPPSMPPPPLPGNSPSQYYNGGGDMMNDMTYENQADQISYQNTPPMPPSFNKVQTSYGNTTTDIAYANHVKSLDSAAKRTVAADVGVRGSGGVGGGPSYMNSTSVIGVVDNNATTVPQFDDDAVTVYDDWDEEWDSDDEVSTTAGSQVFPSGAAPASAINGPMSSNVPSKSHAVKSKGLDLNQRKSTSNDDLPTPPEKLGGGKGGGGSWFSGGGKALDYLMGSLKLNSEVTEEVTIFQTTAGPYWEAYPPGQMIKCLLSDPTKQSKLKGMKKFLAYQLTSTIPSTTGGGSSSGIAGVTQRSSVTGTIVVHRRYKHFDWLYDRLKERYPIVCIPPLPDKQVSGRYESDFIHKRMCRLQHWMNRMSRHPVIGRSQVYRHFISETDANKWKDGKRKAEKDDYKESAFFLTLKTPNAPLDLTEMGAKIDRFTNFALALREKLKVLNARSRDISKCHHTVFKTTLSKFGTALKEISDTLSVDARPSNVALASAIEFTGETYEEIAKLYDAQPLTDAVPLCESLIEYAGIISHLPELRALHQCSLHKVRQLQDQEELGRVETEQVQQVQDRTKVVTFSVLAEMNNFQSDRDVDFSDMMRDYLQQQLIFYNNISQRIRLALERFEPRNLQQQTTSAASASAAPPTSR